MRAPMRRLADAAVLFVALSLCAAQPVRAQSEEALIKGTTEFLLDRAYDNYMYILQVRLSANPYLKVYLPNTIRVAQAGDLRSLFLHKTLWRDAVEKDLLDLAKLQLVRLDVIPTVTGLCDLVKEKSAQLERLCALAKDGSKDGTRSIAIGLCNMPGGTGAAATNVVQQLCEKVRTNEVLTVPEAIELVRTVIPGERGEASLLFFGLPDDRVKAATQVIPALLDGLNRVEVACSNLARSNKTKDQKGEEEKKNTSYTACVVEISALLRSAADAEYAVYCRAFGAVCLDRKLGANSGKSGMKSEDDTFADFLRYAMFFAQMADAEEPDTVKALLKSVTIPSVSFGIKREHRGRLLLNAYLGGAYSRPRGDYAVVAPVGIEYSAGTYAGNSYSLMLSPLDFGYPATLKLQGSETAVKTADVFVPGIYVTRGFKEYPLALGVGYSRVKNPDDPDRKRMGRVSIFIAFDMPLYVMR